MNMKLSVLIAFLIIHLAGCSSPADTTGDSQEPLDEPTPDKAEIPSPELPDLGPAPELENEVWLNTEMPLRLSELRGQVVLLDFWTFG
jgi:hypothetical protein